MEGPAPSPRGEVAIVLDAGPAGREPGDTQPLAFEFRDTGIGMDEATLARVLDAFEQAGGGATGRYGGTGLGLSIARRLSEAMGGRLEAHSVPGRGSTFRLAIELPVAPPVQEAPPADAPAAGRSVAGARVLVVDDNPVNRTIAARMLEGMGVEVTLAADGRAALDAVAEASPELVLMDVSMPVMDGHEATRRIRDAEDREGRARLPVLALSAHVGEAHRARCRAAGMDDVLGKPFARDALRAALATHLSPPSPDATHPPEGRDAA